MTTYYQKRGRRYIAVSEYDGDLMAALPEGAHLVVVMPGMRSTKYNVTPEHAPLLAALRMHRDKLLTVMCDAGKARPSGNRALSSKERRAVAAYYAVMGPNAMLGFEWPSYGEVIDALEKRLMEAV